MEPTTAVDLFQWTWPQAVARLASGGLVPQSTLNMSAAVRFIALGGLDFGGALEEVWDLIQVAHDRLVN